MKFINAVKLRIIKWFFDPTLKDNRWLPMTDRTLYLEVAELNNDERNRVFKRLLLYICIACVVIIFTLFI
jgi:hypothetical protein